jgi:hypothetical protein
MFLWGLFALFVLTPLIGWFIIAHGFLAFAAVLFALAVMCNWSARR